MRVNRSFKIIELSKGQSMKDLGYKEVCSIYAERSNKRNTIKTAYMKDGLAFVVEPVFTKTVGIYKGVLIPVLSIPEEIKVKDI